jgi:predicted dienelactone hydrolase
MKFASLLSVCLILLSCPCMNVAADTGAEKIKSSQGAPVYQDWSDGERQRQIPVKIYLPAGGSAPFPVVIFSHGLGGSREAAVYLGECWSQHGYLCVFVQHPGSDTEVWKSGMAGGRTEMFQRMQQAANGSNLMERARDVKFVLDELERRNRNDKLLKGKLSLDKIALGGHSFGAGTALVIAGQKIGPGGRFDLHDGRVKAAMYLCPPVMGGRLPGGKVYENIRIPGLLLTGTEDISPIGNTTAEQRRIPYDGINASHQYLVNFIGADHATFGGRSFRQAKESDAGFHKMIEQVTTKFLDAALKGDASAQKWLDSAQVSDYLGKAAKFEKK